mmetsp:Transcript_23043/g.25722  ORF Transcript_23043/g.25722 Transcript_23043/m.25722 type:complete len:80 (+) Transcript_23043:257-496(+)
MIQPALVVYGKDGNVIAECSWSWKTMGIEEGCLTAMALVPTQEWAGPIKEVPLVTMRPVMSDIVDSVEEKRMIKLDFAL